MRVEYREEPCKTALSRSPSGRFGFAWSLNPYTGCAHRCTFCYVRGFERRADRPSGEAYGTSIWVKTNVVAVLRRELGRASWKREVVAIGTATDPYQPAEGRYRLTRGCIEALGAAPTPFNLITRGPLIVRDIDVLAAAAARAEVSVSVSIGTLDRDAWRTTEPATAPPHQRLRAVRALVDAGIRCGVSIAPILPGLTDAPAQLEAVVRAARDAGATHLWCAPLNLRPGTREHFLEQLARDWPEQLPRYAALYERPYLAPGDAAPMFDAVQALRDAVGIADRRERPIVPAPAPRQLTLFG
ncbi:MAG: radical SAM protein [Dehalococcoidia bacterium]|nr:radical SAM protein [Dehalococcoidia bacterium]